MSDSSNDKKMAKADFKAARAKAKALRPWFKKKRFILPIAFVVIFGLSSAINGANSDVSPNSNSPSTTTEEITTEQESSEYSNETVSQTNARKKAEQYLDSSAFSRTGLIEQLEYEEFSKVDATYGVDALKVDWNEQAAKKAAQYLDSQAFSKNGLIEQLEFEGFSNEEATYGVSTTGL